MQFSELSLAPELLSTLSENGFTQATPIQQAAIPLLLSGRDLIGRARTGAGKTLAFGLPLLQLALVNRQRALVLCPTRELAQQTAKTLSKVAPTLGIATLCGGTPYAPQVERIPRSHIFVGTPGRVRDLTSRGHLSLETVQLAVLDEADRMLNLGFLDDIRTILSSLPSKRQLAMFSATMPDAIRRTAERFLRQPEWVQVEQDAISVGHIQQQWTLVPKARQREALGCALRGLDHQRVLVFVETKRRAAELGRELQQDGFPVAAMHGDLTQSQRQDVLSRFRDGDAEILVATDVAARGLDVADITHVINVDPPRDLETYVHRIGRTGRVGRPGLALSFSTSKQKRALHELGAAIGLPIPAVDLPCDGPRPEWCRLAAEFGRPPPAKAADCNEVRIYCSIGRKQRVRPADLVGLLTKEAGLTGTEIGRIELLEQKSFVGLSATNAARVLEDFPVGQIRDHTVRFALADA